MNNTTIAETVQRFVESPTPAVTSNPLLTIWFRNLQLTTSSLTRTSVRNCVSVFKLHQQLPPIVINNKVINVAPHAKLLGLNISIDLTWNIHTDATVRKVPYRLYLLWQLRLTTLNLVSCCSYSLPAYNLSQNDAARLFPNALPNGPR